MLTLPVKIPNYYAMLPWNRLKLKLRSISSRLEHLESAPTGEQLVSALVVEPIDQLTHCIQELAKVMRDHGPAADRLEDLERNRAMWEVDMAALVADAKGTYHSANNAEARTRTMKRHYEKNADPFDVNGEEIPVAVQAGNAERGEGNGMPAVRLALATNDKTHAVRTKWGIA